MITWENIQAGSELKPALMFYWVTDVGLKFDPELTYCKLRTE